MILALAHAASVDQFGVAALMMAVIMMFLGFNRGAIGTVLLLLANYPRDKVRAEGGFATTWAIGTLTIASFVVVGCSAVLEETWLGVAFAVVAPVIALQDTLRITSIAMGNARAAVISDGLWTVWVMALFIVNILGVWDSPEGSVYVWGLGGAAASVVLLAATGVKLRFLRVFEWWTLYWRSRIRFGCNYSLDQVGAVMMTALATVIVGTAAAASLRGAYTLFGPLAILFTASSLIFVPQARRSTDSVMVQWRRMMMSSGVMSVLGVATVVLFLCIPDALGNIILGDIWQPAMDVVPYMGVGCVAIAWLVSGYNMLAAQGMSAVLLRVHIIQVVLIGIFTAIGGLVLHTAAGIAIGEAVAGWLAVLIVLTTVSRVVKRRSSHPDTELTEQSESKPASAKVS
jgi:hypothetical protein